MTGAADVAIPPKERVPVVVIGPPMTGQVVLIKEIVPLPPVDRQVIPSTEKHGDCTACAKVDVAVVEVAFT